MGLKTAIREAGRVLSKANEDKLSTAAEHVQTAHGHIQDVIASVAGGAADGAKDTGDGMTEAYKPQPYKVDPDETVQCPNCGKMDSPDAKFCDQCGFKLSGASGVKVDGKVVEAERSYQQLTDLIDDAAQAAFGGTDDYGMSMVCVCDVYEDYAIVAIGDDLVSVPWAVGANGDVSLGNATPVMVTYTATTAMSGDGDHDADDGVMAPPGVPTAESKRVRPQRRLTEADAPTKTENGKAFGKADYAYTPSDAPGSWKLRLTATPGGKPDPTTVGAAAAALGAGFRGQKVDIPAADLAAVKAKVRTAWKQANPDKDATEMPDGIKESAAILTGELVPLVEAAIKDDGTAKVKVIEPGWGSSGFYGPDVLKRDGPKAFPKGTHMYLDHPTVSEAAERPERSLNDLIATTTEDAHWIDRGPDGPGLYTTAQIREDCRDILNQLAPHTGVSIHASGHVEVGDWDGRHGPIVKSIAEASESPNSIDFVTRPGAGGHMVELFESARTAPGRTATMADETKLTEALSEIARLKEVNVLRDAEAFVAARLRSVDLPDMTRARIAEALAKNPPSKDGVLDREALAIALDEAVTRETAYLVEVAGYGRVAGMGAPTPVDANDPVKLQESLTEAFAGLGLSPEAAKLAAQGRR